MSLSKAGVIILALLNIFLLGLLSKAYDEAQRVDSEVMSYTLPCRDHR